MYGHFYWRFQYEASIPLPPKYEQKENNLPEVSDLTAYAENDKRPKTIMNEFGECLV
jgi:hypothetical protein